MIKVDILSPVGGLHGGIENVIKAWIDNLSPEKFDIRVIHMTPGVAYLNGYKKAFAFEGSKDKIDLEYYVKKYGQFIMAFGSPDICVTTNWPLMAVVGKLVKDATNASFQNVSWVHNNLAAYEKAGYGGVAHLTYADAHFSINNQIRDKILMIKPDSKIYSIGNPAKLQEFVDEHQMQETMDNAFGNDANDSKVMAYVGRLDEVKRVDIILEAMYRAKSNWRLKIVGTGPLEDELKECVKYLKLEDKVKFFGWQENPWEFCKDACIMVSASEYEGYMLTGAEAMSMGMTVVATPVDGLVDYLIPGKNGYLYEHDDACGLANILDMIASGDLPLCSRRFCKNSVAEYSMENYIKRVEAALEDQYNYCIKR